MANVLKLAVCVAHGCVCVADCEATGLVCRHLEDRNNHVLWSVGVDRASEIGELLDRLQAAAIPTKDISNIEAVQVCLTASACFFVPLYALQSGVSARCN